MTVLIGRRVELDRRVVPDVHQRLTSAADWRTGSTDQVGVGVVNVRAVTPGEVTEPVTASARNH